MDTPKKTQLLRGYEIYNFGRPYLGHYNYILSFPLLCLGVEKKLFKEKMNVHFLPQNDLPLGW